MVRTGFTQLRDEALRIRKRQVKIDGEKGGEEMARIRFTSGKKREENDGGTERHK